MKVLGSGVPARTERLELVRRAANVGYKLTRRAGVDRDTVGGKLTYGYSSSRITPNNLADYQSRIPVCLSAYYCQLKQSADQALDPS